MLTYIHDAPTTSGARQPDRRPVVPQTRLKGPPRLHTAPGLSRFVPLMYTTPCARNRPQHHNKQIHHGPPLNHHTTWPQHNGPTAPQLQATAAATAAAPSPQTNLVDAGVVDPQQHAHVGREVRPDAIPGLGDEAVLLAAPGRGVRVGEGRGGVRPHPRVGHEDDERSAPVRQVPVSHQRPVGFGFGYDASQVVCCRSARTEGREDEREVHSRGTKRELPRSYWGGGLVALRVFLSQNSLPRPLKNGRRLQTPLLVLEYMYARLTYWRRGKTNDYNAFVHNAVYPVFTRADLLLPSCLERQWPSSQATRR